MRGISKSFSLIFWGVALVTLVAHADAPSKPIQLETLSTHSRFTIFLDAGIKPEVRFEKDQFEVFFPGMALVDLGAPFGNEKQWVDEFAKLGDYRLRSIEFHEKKEGLVVQGTWRFPTDADAPANPKMEHFEFREASPSRWVMDFWLGKGPTIAQVRVQQEQERRRTALEEARKMAQARAQQRSVKRRKDIEAADAVRFCSLPLSEESDFFLDFLPAHTQVDFSQWFSISNPDRDFKYLHPEGLDKDAELARMALDLYGKSKFGLAIRTVEFIEHDYPKSHHIEEMQFLKASALVRLGHQVAANDILEKLTLGDPNSGVTVFASTYIAAKSFNDGGTLTALEGFLKLIRNHSSHRLAWVFHLGAAESLYQLRQTDRALPEYEWITQNSTNKSAQALAAFRIGNLFLYRNQYDQAIASYAQALQRFAEFADKQPEVYLNRGEALYGLRQWDRAEVEFKKFLEKRPGHVLGWRASFRLGEINGRRGGTFKQAANDWFLRTVNDFPSSRGATLARLRLLPCGDHAGMGLETARRFIEQEAKQFKGEDEVRETGYQDLLYVQYVRYLIAVEREDLAVEVLALLMGGGVSERARIILGDTFKVVFKTNIEKILAQGKDLEALSFYERYIGLIPPVGTPLTADVFLPLARAASNLELPGLSAELMDRYWKQTSRALASEPTLDDLLKRSEESFSEAKGAWIAIRNATKSDEAAGKKVQDLLTQVIDESPYSYQRELILSVMADQAKDLDRTRKHAEQAEVLMDKFAPSTDPQVYYWIAQILGKQDRRVASAEALEKLVATMDADPSAAGAKKVLRYPAVVSIGIPEIPPANELSIQIASLYEQEGLWKKAAETYDKLVTRGFQKNRTRYAKLRALKKLSATGDAGLYQTAIQQTLEEISKSDENDFWKKLAQEELANPK